MVMCYAEINYVMYNCEKERQRPDTNEDTMGKINLWEMLEMWKKE